eukprot:TRINITY_DN21748_c0_g1_i1.p1 TRINITY_DN21748_c0_g1~~TRINITY_DN21748_c0_g1_i1.p1  ORF type:complete len:739 (+),score=82.45 TRINITY_DN21748_c0_g1_i1:58-2274(+)
MDETTDHPRRVLVEWSLQDSPSDEPCQEDDGTSSHRGRADSTATSNGPLETGPRRQASPFGGREFGSGSASPAPWMRRRRVSRVSEQNRSKSVRDPLADAVGPVRRKNNMWYFDLNPQRLVPRFLLMDEVALARLDPGNSLMARPTRGRGETGDANAEPERMVRKSIWSKYGTPMHFMSLDFQSEALEVGFEKDNAFRNMQWLKQGVCLTCGACILLALNGVFGRINQNTPPGHDIAFVTYPLVVGAMLFLQGAQLYLDHYFVNLHLRHVTLFWAMVQASCVLFHMLVVTPARFPELEREVELCDLSMDELRIINILDANLMEDIHRNIVDKISNVLLFAVLVYRLRFLHTLYVALYLNIAYVALTACNMYSFHWKSVCVPATVHIKTVCLVTVATTTMSYVVEVITRTDYVQAAAVWKESVNSNFLLRNTLPRPVIDQLKSVGGRHGVAQSYAAVTVLFADVVGFTTMSAQISAQELVELLNTMFNRFDDLAERLGVEKIKTIGDCYMCAAGLPIPSDDHASVVARFGLQMLETVANGEFQNPATGDPLQVRAGLHSGPAVAGVIGHRKFAYDLWGDAVNTASRMESHGEPMRLHCSEETRALLGADFICEARGPMKVKGKGEMNTYFVVSERGRCSDGQCASECSFDTRSSAMVDDHSSGRDSGRSLFSVVARNVRALSRKVSSLGLDGGEDVHRDLVPSPRRSRPSTERGERPGSRQHVPGFVTMDPTVELARAV